MIVCKRDNLFIKVISIFWLFMVFVVFLQENKVKSFIN